MTLTDLPASLQLNIMQRLWDGRDLVSLGQVCPELGALTEDRLLWKRLCQYHFTDRQARGNERCIFIQTSPFVSLAVVVFKMSALLTTDYTLAKVKTR